MTIASPSMNLKVKLTSQAGGTRQTTKHTSNNIESGVAMGAMAFWECVRETWVEAARFIRHRPLVVASAFAILLVCNAVPLALTGAYGPVPPGSASKLVQWIATSVRLAAVVALSIQVMRYVILGERESHLRRVFGTEFWRYVGLSFVIGIGSIVVALLVVGIGYFLTHSFKAYFGRASLQLFLWGVIALCVIIFLAVRFSLLFCHVAIGRTARWRASWNDTRGHFWRIIVSHVLAGLPVELCLIGGSALIATLGSAGKSKHPYLVAIVLSLFTSVGLVVGSACASWLYRRFARTLADNP